MSHFEPDRIRRTSTDSQPVLSNRLMLFVILPSLFIGLQLFIHLINGSDLVCVLLLGLTLGIGLRSPQ